MVVNPFLLALPLVALTTCGWAQSVTATDLLGRTVTLPAPAQRVIADTITGLGQLIALGIEPIAVFCAPGMEPSAYLLAERNMVVPQGLPCINGADWATDWEIVAAQKPDLFIGWGQEDVAIAADIVPFFGTKAFSADGSSGDSLTMYDASLLGIGTLTGRLDKAEAVLQATKDRVAAYDALAPQAGPKVLHVYTSGDGVFWIFGQGSLNCQLLDMIADCVAPGEDGEFYVQSTSELLLQINPDVLLIVAYEEEALTTDGGFAARMAGDPLWVELAAVKSGKALLLPYDTRASSIFGINDYLDSVAPIVLPNTFPAALTEDQVAAATTPE